MSNHDSKGQSKGKNFLHYWATKQEAYQTTIQKLKRKEKQENLDEVSCQTTIRKLERKEKQGNLDEVSCQTTIRKAKLKGKND